MPEAEVTCLFCGEIPGNPRDIQQGQEGAICNSCIFFLAARLAEQGREAPPPWSPATDPVSTEDKKEKQPGYTGERSAHDYQTRIDLAAAYIEMGKRGPAVSELVLAMESALVCEDYPTALICAARARSIGDSPALRDRLVEIITRMASSETSGGDG